MSERYQVKEGGKSGMAGAESTPATAGVGEHQPATFDAQGAVGKQFTTEGALGGAAQKVGGPFDKEGTIGKQFTTEGSIGGAVQDKMGGAKQTNN